jgi:hypothetical protein
LRLNGISHAQCVLGLSRCGLSLSKCALSLSKCPLSLSKGTTVRFDKLSAHTKRSPQAGHPIDLTTEDLR